MSLTGNRTELMCARKRPCPSSIPLAALRCSSYWSSTVHTAHSCCKMAIQLAYWDIRGVRNSRNFCIHILYKCCIVRPLIDSYLICLNLLFHYFVMQSSQKNRIAVSSVKLDRFDFSGSTTREKKTFLIYKRCLFSVGNELQARFPQNKLSFFPSWSQCPGVWETNMTEQHQRVELLVFCYLSNQCYSLY